MNPKLCNWTIVKKLGFRIRATYLEKVSGDWNWLDWKRRIMMWFRHVFKYRRQWSLIRQHFLVETEEILLELHSEGFRPVCSFRFSFSSVVQSCPTLYDPMDCNTPGFSVHPGAYNSWSLLKLMSIESVMPSNHLVLCHPLVLLPSVFPNIRVFSNESVLCIRWPQYWSLSCSISLSNEYSGLISFRIDWFDLLAVQGTLKSLPKPQFQNINFSVHSLLYGSTLTFKHDYWKNHSFD